MLLSINKPLAVRAFRFTVIVLAGLLLCFKTDNFKDAQEAVNWSSRCLRDNFDWSNELKVKKWDVYVSFDFFVRYRKTYTNGKQEYYSFKLTHFNSLNYTGTANQGVLELKTDEDDIIEQTFADPAGDQDNMIQSMKIPVKYIAPSQLDSLRAAFMFVKNTK